MSEKVRKFRLPLIWCGVALIYILPFLALDGFGAAYMKFEGIEGEATDDKHKEEIDVLSWSWGVENTASIETGAHQSSGRATLSNFTFTHEFDRTSPVLALKCFKGEHIPEAIFTATRSIEGGEVLDYFTITFSDVLVASLSHAGDGSADQLPVENVGISYAKIEFKYTQYDKAGNTQGDIRAGWDLEANKER